MKRRSNLRLMPAKLLTIPRCAEVSKEDKDFAADTRFEIEATASVVLVGHFREHQIELNLSLPRELRGRERHDHGSVAVGQNVKVKHFQARLHGRVIAGRCADCKLRSISNVRCVAYSHENRMLASIGATETHSRRHTVLPMRTKYWNCGSST